MYIYTFIFYTFSQYLEAGLLFRNGWIDDLSNPGGYKRVSSCAANYVFVNTAKFW